MVPFLLPVYQTLPAASRVTVCGLAPSGSGYSAIAPVTGSILPIRLPHWPAHQMVPSGASMGSRERCPRLGTCHSLKRSEEHTSELQSLMRISYAVFCLKNKTTLQ